MYRKNDIIMAVDYHDGNFVVRQLDTQTGEECLPKRPTTAVRNWLNRYPAHETWLDRDGLWSAVGMERLRAFAARLTGLDAVTWSVKLDEWDHLASLIKTVEAELFAVHKDWPLAQRIDEIYGIAEISSVSILARIGPIKRFSNAEGLIAFAGLAPGVRGSDDKLRYGRIGGGGTDKHLRHYIIEATIWARRIPRYQKRGKKIGRLVVGRLLLRSIYKMLRDGVRFDRVPQNRVVA